MSENIGSRYANVLSVLNAPWAIEPDKLSLIVAAAEARIVRGERLDTEAADARSGRGLDDDAPDYRVVDGVAHIPMVGTMGRRMNLFTHFSGGVSTQIVQAQLERAAGDKRVRGILLEVDSPGGTVDGTRDLARTIRRVAAEKNVVAAAVGLMASAGYWTGSAAGRVIATEETARIGSIGVATQHIDISRANEARGVTVTDLFVGKYKRVGSSNGPLSKDDRAVILRELDAMYQLFVGAVATHRGVSADVAHERMGDGRIFLAGEALERGLIDAIEPIEVIADMARGNRLHAVALGASTTSQPENRMDKAELAAKYPDAAKALREDGAAEAKIRAEATAEVQAKQHAQDVAAARDAGAAAERERLARIDALAMPGDESLVAKLKEDGTSVPDAAIALCEARKARGDTLASAYTGDAPGAVKLGPAAEGRASASDTRDEQAKKADALASEKGISFIDAFRQLYG